MTISFKTVNILEIITHCKIQEQVYSEQFTEIYTERNKNIRRLVL